MSSSLAAILGGAAGAIALLVVVIGIGLCWHFVFKRRSSSRRSGTGSSDPSLQVGGVGTEFALLEARRYEMEELVSATRNFDGRSLIGRGKFGEVYRGLLNDGMLVAIKTRRGSLSPQFTDEVRNLSFIRHRNLVTLLGYCQENDQQILVYEYIPNGSVSLHLYGTGRVGAVKLEFKHRLAIALGAARGLDHLHSLTPRLIHKDFKTANVVVDEDFIPKVADAGILDLLRRLDDHGEPSSSQQPADDIFLAPEVRALSRYSDRSDVYSFGVFLLELICGREATQLVPSPGIAEWIEEQIDNRSRIVDKRLGNSYTKEGMDELMQLMMLCLQNSSERRPSMSQVVTELDRILEKEMSLTIIMGEGTPVVTLGSQLFRASK